MASTESIAASESSLINLRWRDLYRVATIISIVALVIVVFAIPAFVIWPYAPGRLSTEEIFALIQGDPFGALISFDFLLLLGNFTSIVLFVALYVALKRVNESYALIALVMGIFAGVLLVPARPILELFHLSDLYSAAATESVRMQVLAAGETLLAAFDGIAWFTNTLLGGITLTVFSLLMLQSSSFGKATAYVGLVTNIAVCAFFVPVIGTFLLFLSVPGYIVWYILLTRDFFKMGWGAAPAE